LKLTPAASLAAGNGGSVLAIRIQVGLAAVRHIVSLAAIIGVSRELEQIINRGSSALVQDDARTKDVPFYCCQRHQPILAFLCSWYI
jgi:hypothetical protein